MPPKTASTATKKATKKQISASMEDVPLFAGLDNFVFVPVEKKGLEKKPVKKTVKKKKPAAKAKEESAKKKTTTAATKKTVTKQKPKAAIKKPAATGKSPARVARPIKPPVIGPDDILLSIREVCALLKISRATLVRMDNSGKLPGRIMIGGSVRFHRKTIDAWIQGMVSGSAE